MAKLKPVGGIESVVLYRAGEVAGVESTADGCKIVGVDGSSPIALTIMEQSAQAWTSVERVASTLRATHRLRVKIEEPFANELLTPQFLLEAAHLGFVAQITTLSGDEMVMGWSPRFGAASPLKLEELVVTSGEQRIQTPHSTFTLCSIDDSLPIKKS